MTVLRSRVEDRVKSRSHEVLRHLFENRLDRHNDRCGCNYCNLLVRYERALHYKRVWARRFDDDLGYDSFAANSLTGVATEARLLKQEKDKLKVL